MMNWCRLPRLLCGLCQNLRTECLPRTRFLWKCVSCAGGVHTGPPLRGFRRVDFSQLLFLAGNEHVQSLRGITLGYTSVSRGTFQAFGLQYQDHPERRRFRNDVAGGKKRSTSTSTCILSNPGSFNTLRATRVSAHMQRWAVN